MDGVSTNTVLNCSQCEIGDVNAARERGSRCDGVDAWPGMSYMAAPRTSEHAS